VTEVELERAFERELERIRAISDPEERFAEAKKALESIARFNPLFAEVRGGASLDLKNLGWTLERIGDRFGLSKSAAQRIVDVALGRPQRPRTRRG